MSRLSPTNLKPADTSGASPVSILLAEDSAIYRRLIEAHLEEWGFHLVCARDGREAWKELTRKDAPHLALLDWVLPEIDGVELCHRLRARTDQSAYTYTILLTAKTRKEEMLEAMRAGADDFLAKPFDPPELKARLMVGKRIIELQDKLLSANIALRHAASHDFLTATWNRGEILGFLQRELARARRDKTPVGVVLADVDHFKRVNDTYGHDSGDCVLKEVSRRLGSSLREYDGVGRYGGEEFLLVIPGCDLPTTMRRANQIRESIAQQAITTPLGPVTVTVSMGVTVAEASLDSNETVRLADIALYQAKENGRNRVEQAPVLVVSR